MDASGCYLTIESLKRTSPQSFTSFLAKGLYDWVEERKGDFSALETEDGADYVLFLIGQYEDGDRVQYD